MSSGAESDDSSGPDSPSVVLPLRTASVATQQLQLTRPSGSSSNIIMMEPNGLQGLGQEKHENGNSSNTLGAANGGVSIRMSNSKGISAGQLQQKQQQELLSRLDGLVSDIPSGLYPQSAFQHIPPEIVMQLVEMGHLKFHSNEGKLLDNLTVKINQTKVIDCFD